MDYQIALAHTFDIVFFGQLLLLLLGTDLIGRREDCLHVGVIHRLDVHKQTGVQDKPHFFHSFYSTCRHM